MAETRAVSQHRAIFLSHFDRFLEKQKQLQKATEPCCIFEGPRGDRMLSEVRQGLWEMTRTGVSLVLNALHLKRLVMI